MFTFKKIARNYIKINHLWEIAWKLWVKIVLPYAFLLVGVLSTSKEMLFLENNFFYFSYIILYVLEFPAMKLEIFKFETWNQWHKLN
jgi:hypothetical protein